MNQTYQKPPGSIHQLHQPSERSSVNQEQSSLYIMAELRLPKIGSGFHGGGGEGRIAHSTKHPKPSYEFSSI